jgi:predicted NodU family carbamoyl transferase
MSVKTRENLAGSEIQQQRQAIAKAAVDRILSETPRQISMEMYAREVAFIAFAEGWNAKADNIASELAALKKQVQVAEAEAERLRRGLDGIEQIVFADRLKKEMNEL